MGFCFEFVGCDDHSRDLVHSFIHECRSYIIPNVAGMITNVADMVTNVADMITHVTDMIKTVVVT